MLRTVPGSEAAPMLDYMTLYRVLSRLNNAVLKPSLCEVVQPLIPVRSNRWVTVAADATGLTSGAIGMFFVKGTKDLGPGLCLAIPAEVGHGCECRSAGDCGPSGALQPVKWLRQVASLDGRSAPMGNHRTHAGR
jgi:hypothetical protein